MYNCKIREKLHYFVTSLALEMFDSVLDSVNCGVESHVYISHSFIRTPPV